MPDSHDDPLFDDLDDVTCPEYSDFELLEEDLYTEEEITEKAEARKRDKAARAYREELEAERATERMQTREASKKSARRPRDASPSR